MTARLHTGLLAAWKRDRVLSVFVLVTGFCVLAAIVVFAMLIPIAIREERRLQALPPAERAVVRHVMPDGTICYQPRDGWSRPLSCVRDGGATPAREGTR